MFCECFFFPRRATGLRSYALPGGVHARTARKFDGLAGHIERIVLSSGLVCSSTFKCFFFLKKRQKNLYGNTRFKYIYIYIYQGKKLESEERKLVLRDIVRDIKFVRKLL